MKMLKLTSMVAGLILCASQVQAQTFSQAIFFGDSLTDSGRVGAAMFNDPLLSIMVDENDKRPRKFTTNTDNVWAEALASKYGLTVVANDGESLAGTNYAMGGAKAKDNVINSSIEIESAHNQINRYLGLTNQQADPNALYSVWIGANDLLDITSAATALDVIDNATTVQTQSVQQLANAGAKYILVPSLPDVGVAPLKLAEGEASAAQATFVSQLFNQSLYQKLNQSQANVIPLNTFALVQEISKNPSAYGIKNSTGRACKLTPFDVLGRGSSASLVCFNEYAEIDTRTGKPETDLVEENANQTYAFADDLHPSGRTHQILADYAKAIIDAPAQMAGMPTAILKQGQAHHANLHRRLDRLNVGKNSWWIEGDAAKLRQSDLKTDGIAPAVRFGADVAKGKGHTGFFAQYQKHDLNLSAQSRADIQQYGFGLYHRVEPSQFRLNLFAGYDFLDVATERQVQWHVTPRQHRADGKGRHLYASAQMSYGVPVGEQLSIRPYLGVQTQRVELNELTEDQATLSTAMKFHKQRETSLQGSAGLNVAYRLPSQAEVYGGVGYQREFDKPNNTMTASLASTGLYRRGFTVPVVTSTDKNSLNAHLGVGMPLAQGLSLNTHITLHKGGSQQRYLGGLIGVQGQF